MAKKTASTTSAVTEKQKCTCCGADKPKEAGFYKSYSIIYKSNDSRLTTCKQCMIDVYTKFNNQLEDEKQAVFIVCRLLDIYFDETSFNSAFEQAKNQDSNPMSIYMQKINSLPQWQGKTFSDSNTTSVFNHANGTSNKDVEVYSVDDAKNKQDVLRMLNYDPFEGENYADKRNLYNKLVDFLDESTLEDSFKLPAVIEIVKSFNQIDKINQAIALLTYDVNTISSQVGGVKSLIDAKDKMLRAILAMAKDNGISVNHNNNRSKGAGTLSGIIKQLQEKGFEEIAVNLFDIETSEGIRQVADISNKSVLNQLQFDENDYTEMLTQQRELIIEIERKYSYLEEENRKLKIQLKSGDVT